MRLALLLAQAEKKLARRYNEAFASAFRNNPKPLFLLADHILEPNGGRLFEGYTSRSDLKLRRTPPSTFECE